MKNKPSLSGGNVRQKVLVDTLKKNIGHKVFLLTHAFPYVLIGSIVTVEHDFLLIDVWANSLSDVQKGKVHLKIEEIDAFYIEETGLNIPYEV